MGSNAGAGSGEFHMYRQVCNSDTLIACPHCESYQSCMLPLPAQARRREMMRQARFETEAVEQQANDEYEVGLSFWAAVNPLQLSNSVAGLGSVEENSLSADAVCNCLTIAAQISKPCSHTAMTLRIHSSAVSA